MLTLPEEPWHGGAGYYSQFPAAAARGWATDGFFPFVMFPNSFDGAEQVAWDAQIANAYHGANEWSTWPDMPAHGMSWVGGQLESLPGWGGTMPTDFAPWVGHAIDDEIDGTNEDPEDGIAAITAQAATFDATKGRFTFANFTQRVLQSDWAKPGGGYWGADFVNHPDVDVICADMYWYTLPDASFNNFYVTGGDTVKGPGARAAGSYGALVRAMRYLDGLDGHRKPVWVYIDLLSGSPGEAFVRYIDPAQLKAAVMSCITNGATGIAWFNNVASATHYVANVARDAQVNPGNPSTARVQAAKEIREFVEALAPVINTPTLVWDFGASTIDTMLKQRDGHAYIFAIPGTGAGDGPTLGSKTFTLPAGTTGPVEVVGESRSLTVTAGTFTDTFPTEATWHVYRLPLTEVPTVDIAAENSITTGRDSWSNITVTGWGDLNAQGFARQVSVNVGQRIEFSVDGDPTVIDIYRAGWYGSQGFRKVATITNTPTVQPEATTIPNSNGATTCTGWSVTAYWDVPEDAVSGMYIALVRSVPPFAPNGFHIPFVVRDDDAVVDIIYKTSDSTWGAAYNHYGTKANVHGRNVYGAGTGVGNIMERSYAADYHRPVITRQTVQQTYWWACEMPLIRFLERQGYRVKYVTSVDLDKMGVALLTGKGKIFLSSGHDEYWTQPMRTAVETFRDDHGGHSIFMSGNEVFWKARYVHDGDRSTLWCHKDTMPGPSGVTRTAGSPLDPVEWTGTWKDTRWPDHNPEWFLTGTSFGMNGVYDYDAVIPKNPYGGLKVWGGSALVDSDVTLTRVMGFEADHAHPTQPAGSSRILAAYTRAAPGGLSDANGENYNVPGNIEWGIVAQRYESGAVTVGFGTCQWSWTLDGVHDRGTGTEVSTAAQQFTVNLLRDLGADPVTLMSGVTLQPVNSLNEYGVIPATTEPENPAPEGAGWRFRDGQSATPWVLSGGQLTQLH